MITPLDRAVTRLGRNPHTFRKHVHELTHRLHGAGKYDEFMTALDSRDYDAVRRIYDAVKDVQP